MITLIYRNPNDPEVIIKIDVCNAFNSSDRAFSLDCINGRASRDYICGLNRDDVIGTVDSLTNSFGYFKAMRGCHSKLRYFDWDVLNCGLEFTPSSSVSRLDDQH